MPASRPVAENRQSQYEGQQDQQSHEAVHQIQRDPSLLQETDPVGARFDRPFDWGIEPIPPAIKQLQGVPGGGIKWCWQQARYAEKRSKYMPNWLTEPFGGVLHARRLIGKSAIPRRTAPNSPMVEAAHQQEGDSDG